MRRVAGYVAKWAGMATTWAGMLAKVSQTQPVSGVHAYSVLVGIRLVGLKLQPVQTNLYGCGRTWQHVNS